MQPTEDEAKGFWPVYEAYQKDLEGLNQQLFGVIKTSASERAARCWARQ